ncbi:probable membrane-associated kinase regulator 4 [Cryptomeria japonica]|uniref:probable membrane-associated kinase regulator 4 n=1 Tax=Cryptomeria japonica TaxID=3369 RepID=UPI0025ACC97A|nr:probable membrane-associated kinase regulator 4 [Cryptomeria japonica]
MAASNYNLKHGQEHENSRKISDLVSEEFSKDGRHFGTRNSCFDFNEFADDDYIDIEVESAMFWEAVSRTKLNGNRAESREFEFDAKALMDDPGCVASPADELFYKGQLLPLHLPPRIQMVENLLASEKSKENKPQSLLGREKPEQNSGGGGSFYRESADDSAFFHTPYESCDATPYDSCEASQELNADLYEAFKENHRVTIKEAAEAESKREKHQRLPMLKKAKKLLDSTQSKQAALALKLKASRLYLKSLFSKSTETKDQNQHQRRTKELDQRDLMNNTSTDQADQNRVTEAINRYVKVIKPGSANGNMDITREGYKVAEAVAKTIHKENSSMIEDHVGRRKSFSGSLPSSKVNVESQKANVSYCSNRVIPSPIGAFLKRSSSTNIDMESAIEGAIAHCKQSAHSASKNNIDPSHINHQRPCSNVEGYVRPRSGSRIAVCEQPEKSGLCRG